MKRLILFLVYLVILILSHYSASAQNNVIKGLVLDERNKPVRDVGIYSIDSTFLTLTNGDGQFTLTKSQPVVTINDDSNPASGSPFFKESAMAACIFLFFRLSPICFSCSESFVDLLHWIACSWL